MNRIKTALFLYAKLPFDSSDRKPEAEAELLATEIRHLMERRALRLSVYLPGPIAEAMVRRCPKDVAWMREKVMSGHLEFVGGGYHDPMLPLFPALLQEMQLQRHKDILRSNFANEPEGYFNSCMAWEIGMVEILERKGFTYALLPEAALQDALGRQTDLSGWFTTEDRGSVMRLLSYSASYSELWKSSSRPELMAGLKAIPESDRTFVAVLPLDCSAPDSLHAIFSTWGELLDTADSEGVDLQTWTLSHVLEQQTVEGKVSLVSYVGDDTGLPPGTHSCRELLLRRPETDFFHKRLLSVYRRAAEHETDLGHPLSWDGLLDVMASHYYRDRADGMRDPLVRWKAHHALIEAEKAMLPGDDETVQRVSVIDMLMDGHRQILGGNTDMGFVVEPRHGAWLRHLDFRPSAVNLASALRDDAQVAPLFLEHLIPEDLDQPQRIDAWIQDRQGALRFPYDYQIKRHGDRMQILLDSEQSAVVAGKTHVFRAEKAYSFNASGAMLVMGAQFTNSTFQAFRGYLATEICIAYRGVGAKTQSLAINGSKIDPMLMPFIHPEAVRIEIRDRLVGAGLRIDTIKPVRVLLAPILGSGSLAAPDMAQGLRLVLFRDVELKGQESASLNVRMRIGRGRIILP